MAACEVPVDAWASGDATPHGDVIAAYDGPELLARAVIVDGGQEAFASWFSGWSTPEQLQLRSSLTGTGSESDLAMLRALTAGPTPTMAEFF